MKTKNINQEILLVTNTTLARREWCAKDALQNKAASAEEQLEEACWNGLLDELLPGIVERSASGKKLSLWQIVHCSSFLEIDLSESPFLTNEEFSVSPYLFLRTMHWN